MEFVGYAVQLVWHCDNSAARALAKREGVGRVKHLAVKTLWLQALQKSGEISCQAVPTADNKADLGTKHHPQQRLELLRR
eukprot:1661876-Alexandrium_andersonii.AAC.1